MTSGIQRLFGEVPHTYETVNHVLTLGLDILWRRRVARSVAHSGGTLWLDMCSGTGETAVYLERLARGSARVVACDFSAPMLRKAREKPAARGIDFVLGSAAALPFPDYTFDAVVMSFATRNLNVTRDHLIACFSEYLRVLKPGSVYVNLETSQPRSPWIRRLVHAYVGLTVRPIGALISGSRAGYSYLAHTIPRFYDADELADILYEAGFETVAYERLLFGVAAIHEAKKAVPSTGYRVPST